MNKLSSSIKQIAGIVGALLVLYIAFRVLFYNAIPSIVMAIGFLMLLSLPLMGLWWPLSLLFKKYVYHEEVKNFEWVAAAVFMPISVIWVFHYGIFEVFNKVMDFCFGFLGTVAKYIP